MKLIRRIILLSFIFTLFACENEVDINTEFEEVTAVYGLLDRGVDTQFVKITRTFLDDEKSAVQLAGDPANLYYDSLDVKLTEEGTGNVITLSKITLPKENGIFTTERNEVYFTTDPISASRTYNLSIQKPDSTFTSGSVNVIRGLTVLKPAIGPGGRRTVPFVNFRGQITPYIFEFQTGNNVGEFEMELTFQYIEIFNNDSTLKEMVFPMGRVINPQSRTGEKYRVTFNSERIFNEIVNTIPASANAPKRIFPSNNVIVEINSADGDYTLYRDVYGPIDGLAQTRADYTNVTNGIGLFASRSKQLLRANINDDTQNFIIGNYGDITDLAQFRNFQFP